MTGTDGIDVTNTSLGPALPSGIFTAHNDSPSDKPVEVCRFEDTGLLVDTMSWDPRTTVTLDVPRGGAGRTLGLTSQPNPFTATTRVRYELPSAQRVELDAIDVAGRVVAMLASGEQEAGLHEVSWTARTAKGDDLPSGLYFVRLRLGGETFTHKVVVSG